MLMLLAAWLAGWLPPAARLAAAGWLAWQPGAPWQLAHGITHKLQEPVCSATGNNSAGWLAWQPGCC